MQSFISIQWFHKNNKLKLKKNIEKKKVKIMQKKKMKKY